MNLKNYFFLFIIVMLSINLFGQTEIDTTKRIVIEGNCMLTEDGNQLVYITYFKDSIVLKQEKNKGEYVIRLEYNHDYLLEFYKAGYATVVIDVSTKNIPSEQWNKGISNFNTDIELLINQGFKKNDLRDFPVPFARLIFDKKTAKFIKDKTLETNSYLKTMEVYQIYSNKEKAKRAKIKKEEAKKYAKEQKALKKINIDKLQKQKYKATLKARKKAVKNRNKLLPDY